jgi:hypothetical protein
MVYIIIVYALECRLRKLSRTFCLQSRRFIMILDVNHLQIKVTIFIWADCTYILTQQCKHSLYNSVTISKQCSTSSYVENWGSACALVYNKLSLR